MQKVVLKVVVKAVMTDSWMVVQMAEMRGGLKVGHWVLTKAGLKVELMDCC